MFNLATSSPIPGSSLNNEASFVSAYGKCIASSYLILAAWVGLGIALLLSVAAAIYWLLPAWKIRRDGLRPLEIGNTPHGMMAYLAGLCHQAELHRFPVFLLNPYSFSPPMVSHLATWDAITSSSIQG